MSFGWSVSDVALLTKTTYTLVQNTRHACGEHAELTTQVLSLHTVLQRLETDLSQPSSLLNKPHNSSRQDIEQILSGCEKQLSLLDTIVSKYTDLSKDERSAKRFWQRVRFGNGEVHDARDIQAKIAFYTGALTLYLNLVSTASMGRVEQRMEEAGEDIRDVKRAIHAITAKVVMNSHGEGSVLSSYSQDEKVVWKEFRRLLVREGFKSSFLQKNRSVILEYFEELGERGVLDDVQETNTVSVDETRVREDGDIPGSDEPPFSLGSNRVAAAVLPHHEDSSAELHVPSRGSPIPRAAAAAIQILLHGHEGPGERPTTVDEQQPLRQEELANAQQQDDGGRGAQSEDRLPLNNNSAGTPSTPSPANNKDLSPEQAAKELLARTMLRAKMSNATHRQRSSRSEVPRNAPETRGFKFYDPEPRNENSSAEAVPPPRSPDRRPRARNTGSTSDSSVYDYDSSYDSEYDDSEDAKAHRDQRPRYRRRYRPAPAKKSSSIFPLAVGAAAAVVASSLQRQRNKVA